MKRALTEIILTLRFLSILPFTIVLLGATAVFRTSVPRFLLGIIPVGGILYLWYSGVWTFRNNYGGAIIVHIAIIIFVLPILYWGISILFMAFCSKLVKLSDVGGFLSNRVSPRLHVAMIHLENAKASPWWVSDFDR